MTIDDDCKSKYSDPFVSTWYKNLWSWSAMKINFKNLICCNNSIKLFSMVSCNTLMVLGKNETKWNETKKMMAKMDYYLPKLAFIVRKKKNIKHVMDFVRDINKGTSKPETPMKIKTRKKRPVTFSRTYWCYIAIKLDFVYILQNLSKNNLHNMGTC